jgi:hypothetical protein
MEWLQSIPAEFGRSTRVARLFAEVGLPAEGPG